MAGRQENNVLIGQFEAVVGAKGRISLPGKFRKILGERLIITQGYEQTLIIVSEKNWQTLLSGTEGKSFIQSETRETRRFLLGGAFDIELDHKGRFIIPSYLRDFGKIESEVIFLGLESYVEMWDKTRWTEYRERLGKSIGDISQKLIEGVEKGSGK